METSDHFKNGATPKSQMSRKLNIKKMKKSKFLIIASICVAMVTTLSAFRKTEVTGNKYDNCGEWSKSDGISMRQCSDDGRYSYQFFNGYNFEVHFYVIFTYTDGTESCHGGGCWKNLYLDGAAYSDKGENDGVGKKSIQSWRVTSKERKDTNGKWVEF